MSRPHLRQQAGGDPAQGPVREMANPEPGPGAGNDFPDGPDTAGTADVGDVDGELADDDTADTAD